jgi:hypothetical protein
MSPTKQHILAAIETAPDDVLEELLGFLQRRLPHPPSAGRAMALAELQDICREENYSLDTAVRADRETPFLEEG